MEPEQLEELREAFEHYDKDGNGVIDPDEFRALCRGLGAGFEDAEIEAGLRAIDTDGNGTIEFEEFVDWWKDR